MTIKVTSEVRNGIRCVTVDAPWSLGDKAAARLAGAHVTKVQRETGVRLTYVSGGAEGKPGRTIRRRYYIERAV
jgi:hypothetical protein